MHGPISMFSRTLGHDLLVIETVLPLRIIWKIEKKPVIRANRAIIADPILWSHVRFSKNRQKVIRLPPTLPPQNKTWIEHKGLTAELMRIRTNVELLQLVERMEVGNESIAHISKAGDVQRRQLGERQDR